MNEARSTWQIVKIGLSICLGAAFSLGVSYLIGVASAQVLHDDLGAGKSSPGEAIYIQVFMGIVFGLAVGAFVRWLASPRPAWMGAIITVCSIVFLFGFYPGSKVVPRPSFWFPLVFIVVIFAVAFVRIHKAKA
jgi:hypothetical protein